MQLGVGRNSVIFVYFWLDWQSRFWGIWFQIPSSKASTERWLVLIDGHLKLLKKENLEVKALLLLWPLVPFGFCYSGSTEAVQQWHTHIYIYIFMLYVYIDRSNSWIALWQVEYTGFIAPSSTIRSPGSSASMSHAKALLRVETPVRLFGLRMQEHWAVLLNCHDSCACMDLDASIHSIKQLSSLFLFHDKKLDLNVF